MEKLHPSSAETQQSTEALNTVGHNTLYIPNPRAGYGQAEIGQDLTDRIKDRNHASWDFLSEGESQEIVCSQIDSEISRADQAINKTGASERAVNNSKMEKDRLKPVRELVAGLDPSHPELNMLGQIRQEQASIKDKLSSGVTTKIVEGVLTGKLQKLEDAEYYFTKLDERVSDAHLESQDAQSQHHHVEEVVGWDEKDMTGQELEAESKKLAESEAAIVGVNRIRAEHNARVSRSERA